MWNSPHVVAIAVTALLSVAFIAWLRRRSGGRDVSRLKKLVWRNFYQSALMALVAMIVLLIMKCPARGTEHRVQDDLAPLLPRTIRVDRSLLHRSMSTCLIAGTMIAIPALTVACGPRLGPVQATDRRPLWIVAGEGSQDLWLARGVVESVEAGCRTDFVRVARLLRDAPPTDAPAVPHARLATRVEIAMVASTRSRKGGEVPERSTPCVADSDSCGTHFIVSGESYWVRLDGDSVRIVAGSYGNRAGTEETHVYEVSDGGDCCATRSHFERDVTLEGWLAPW